MKLKGFSLVEVLIAVTIIGVVGTITSTILSRTFRASSQTTIISRLKQNGDLALTPIVETIRTAEAVFCYSPPINLQIKALVVRTSDGKYTKFRFVDPVPPTGTPTQNGFIVKQENLNPSQSASFCDTILTSPSEIPITNKDSTSGVSISSGEFIKIAGGTGGKDTVFIRFYVNPTLSSGGNYLSKNVLMNTTVQIR